MTGHSQGQQPEQEQAHMTSHSSPAPAWRTAPSNTGGPLLTQEDHCSHWRTVAHTGGIHLVLAQGGKEPWECRSWPKRSVVPQEYRCQMRCLACGEASFSSPGIAGKSRAWRAPLERDLAGVGEEQGVQCVVAMSTADPASVLLTGEGVLQPSRAPLHLCELGFSRFHGRLGSRGLSLPGVSMMPPARPPPSAAD